MITHNLSYDFGVLEGWKYLEEVKAEPLSVYTKGHTSIITYRVKGCKLELLDNGNYFQSSLAELGESLGMPKLDVNPLEASDEEIDPYCKRDVEILLLTWQNMYDFLDEHDLGSWAKTAPSQAFHAFRHRFMPYPIFIHCNPDALIVERQSYYGGRVSVFYKGDLKGQEYYKLDVNSMYPYVMQRESYPTKFIKIVENPTIEYLADRLQYFAITAMVRVETDEPAYCLRYKNHTLHPVGEFDTTLSTPELIYALGHKHIKQVYRLALYEKEQIFKEFVDFFYPLKVKYTIEDNKPFRMFAKLYMNSLYGKFGQRAETWTNVTDTQGWRIDGEVEHRGSDGKTYRYQRWGNTVWEITDAGEAANSFPGIAAHVTAYARMYLWTLINKAGRDNVYYTDTDSLIVNKQGLTNLSAYIDPDRLGALKLEKTSTNVLIEAPKTYRFGDEHYRKGIPRKAQEVEPDTFEFDAFPSFITQGNRPYNAPFYTKRTRRKLSYVIYDGEVTPSGWIKPMEASELIEQPKRTDETRQAIRDIDEQISALRLSRPIPPSLVFRLYDYRKGNLKRQRDKYGNLVPIEYSGIMNSMTEYGIDTLDDLIQKVYEFLKISEKIATLLTKRHALTRVQQSTTNTPLPF
jgi:hypothetical protein